MFWTYLKSIGKTWKYLVGEALLIVAVLVGLNFVPGELPAWVYWAVLSGAALVAPYWAYKQATEEHDAKEEELQAQVTLPEDPRTGAVLLVACPHHHKIS